MILMCPCIIDFIGGMDYESEWGGGGTSEVSAIWAQECPGPPPPTRPSNPFPPYYTFYTGP